MMAFQALFRRFSIRMRMNGAVFIVLGLFAVVALTAWVGGRTLSGLNHDFMAHSIKEMRQVSAVHATLGEIRQREKDMVIDLADAAQVQRHRAAWTRAIDAVKLSLQGMLEGEEDADNPEAREAIKSLDAYAAAATPVIAQIAAAAFDNAAVANQKLAPARQHASDVERRVTAIDKIVATEVDATREAFQSAMQTTFALFAAVLGVVVVIVVPTTLMNSRSITAPLQRARDVAAAIAQGDLTQRVEDAGADEAGELLRALETMRLSLSSLVGDVRQASHSIGISSGEVASGNIDLSQRTELTASNLQLTASSIVQLTGTVKQSADSAAQANQLATSAAQVAQRGGEVVSQVVQTMEEINTSSKRINDIIGTIDGIAFQTNILALNAAVEAARAGEQGRGFAVVAGEVRSLAQRSASAAREIKGLIGASVDRVEAGTRLVQDAGGTMSEIVASVQRVSDIIAEISSAASEQSAGIGQVNSAVSQLDQMTQQNAALVEESAAAAQSLRDQATKLTTVVMSFRTDDAASRPAVSMSAEAAPAPASKAAVAAAAAPRAAATPMAATPRLAGSLKAATPSTGPKAARPAVAKTRSSSPSPSRAAPVAIEPASDEWETF
jgi:methyl-accepting chemotaxis protein